MALEIEIKKFYAYDPTIDRSFWVGETIGGVNVDMFRGANGEQVAGATLSYEEYEDFRQAVPNARLPVFRTPDAEAEAPAGNTIGHVVGPTGGSAAPASASNPPVEPETPEEEGFWSSASGWVHGALDVAGFIPGVGAIPDLLNAGLYALEGNTAAAAISAVAAVPLVGDAAKGATMVGKAATRIGTHTAKEAAEHSAEVAAREAAEKAAKEKAEREAVQRAERGRDGMRSAGRRRQVPCFNPRGKRFRRMTPEQQRKYLQEYAKQLRRQQEAINGLTAAEFKAARDAFSRVGRNPTADAAQGAMRDAYTRQIRTNIQRGLQQQGMGAAEARKVASGRANDIMSNLAALHEPDMVAGGWLNPDPKAMGRSDVNSAIGGSWNQQGRVASLDAAADESIRNGKGDTKMNVELKPCPPGKK